MGNFYLNIEAKRRCKNRNLVDEYQIILGKCLKWGRGESAG